MKKKDIERLAEKAGLVKEFNGLFPSMRRFARLVAAYERESCASEAEKFGYENFYGNVTDLVANAIRSGRYK